ncbi:unnamed protein product [Clonostachys byssicola]|uniref:PHO85 cyclin-6 n=1 Tax=Clonostachys byssicola TaxID=160290 RepID=A0A9N9XVS5_9HYPO|nr:unnamed protein product [Clonostachys byssicola]
MAAVIGDYAHDPTTPFHTMIANPPLQHHHQHQHPRDSSPYRPTSRSRQSSTPRPQRQGSTTDKVPDSEPDAQRRARQGVSESRLPSPPSSSSPAVVSNPNPTHDGREVHMASDIRDSTTSHGHPSSTSAPREPPSSQQQQPSPASDDFLIANPAVTPALAAPSRQTVIHVRDIAHIKSLAQSNMLGNTGSGLLDDPPLQQMKYDISGMPIADVIEMVAALLTKITSTNDLQHDAMQRNVSHQQQANLPNEGGSGSHIGSMNHSVLAFHGKNVPAITILSYLARIHKYCPTTFEVFLSLLVYFDRMTERVNFLVSHGDEGNPMRSRGQSRATSTSRTDVSMRENPEPDAADETDSDLADDEDEDDEMEGSAAGSNRPDNGRPLPEELPNAHGPSTYFVVDSFNIHRLIIAGVTCSSKFFSDVFYTNSRYAKVGGLPLPELNHLELQFLVLNDFRLAVPVEDLEAYATMLVEFYARETASETPAV